MVNIIGAEIRFMRRIQVREYEPVEVEVKLTAQFAESDDADVSISSVLNMASVHVHDALGLAPNTKLQTRAGGTIKNVAKGTGGGTVVNERQIAAAPIVTQKGEKGSDIPEEAKAPLAAAAAPAPAKAPASGSDIPEEAPPAAAPAKAPAATPAPAAQAQVQPAAAQAVAATDAQALSKWVGDYVRNGKITSDDVKKLYPKYNVPRIAELKPNQFDAFRVDIEKLVQRNTSAADL